MIKRTSGAIEHHPEKEEEAGGKIRQVRYSPRFSKLGLRRATLYISVAGIDIHTLGRQILEMSDSVLFATLNIVGSNIDLVVRVIFWTNAGLISLTNEIKQDGVKGISWNEYAELIGKTRTVTLMP